MKNLLINSARDEIRSKFPDTCFAVANRVGATYSSVQSVIATWPNKLKENPKIQEIAEREWISIVELSSLSKWNTDFLVWKDDWSLKNPSLISDGVIPILNHEWRGVISVTQRDAWGNADNWLFTSVAWRAEWCQIGIDLQSESLREWLEEWAYLGELDWEIFIILPEAAKKIESETWITWDFIGLDNANWVRSYIWNKYLTEGEFDFPKAKNTFEDSFPWLSYSDFPDILRQAYNSWRILFYSTQSTMQKQSETPIIMDGKSIWGFNWYDYKANTLEHRQTYNTNLEVLFDKHWNRVKWVKIYWKDHPQSLYLESKLQWSRVIWLDQQVNKRFIDRWSPTEKIEYHVCDIQWRVTRVVPTTGEFLISQNY